MITKHGSDIVDTRDRPLTQQRLHPMFLNQEHKRKIQGDAPGIPDLTTASTSHREASLADRALRPTTVTAEWRQPNHSGNDRGFGAVVVPHDDHPNMKSGLANDRVAGLVAADDRMSGSQDDNQMLFTTPTESSVVKNCQHTDKSTFSSFTNDVTVANPALLSDSNDVNYPPSTQEAYPPPHPRPECNNDPGGVFV